MNCGIQYINLQFLGAEMSGQEKLMDRWTLQITDLTGLGAC